MPGLFSRVKNWVSREVLTYSDLNAEFDNIINNAEADTLGGYSTTVAQMQQQVSPGGVGTESRPTSISGELERIRFVLARLLGKTYWYESPTRSLSAANADLSWYFPCNGNSVSDVLNNFATRGCRGLTRTVGWDANGVINFTACDPDANTPAVSNTNFVTYSGGTAKKFSLLNTGFVAVDGNSLNANKGTLHIMFRNISAGDYLFHNKALGLEVFANGSGNLVVRATSQVAATQTSKTTFSVTSATAVTGNVAFRQLFVDYVFNGAEGSSQDRLGFTLKSLANAVVDSGALTGQNIIVNTDSFSGGTWYIGNKLQDPATWTGFSAMAVRPDAETAPWTRTSTATDAVSNGILRATSAGFGSASFSRAISPSFGTGATYEWKVNLNANPEGSAQQMEPLYSGSFTVNLQDNAASRLFNIACDRHGIGIAVASAANPVISVPVNISGPTVFRATISSAANPVLNLYVNGAHVAQYTNSTVQAGANQIAFTLGCGANSADCEYFAYQHGALTAPLALNSSGNIDEACLFTGRVTDSALLTSLNAAPVSDVLGKDKILGLRPIALQQPQLPGYSGSNLLSSTQVLGILLGDGQTDVCITGIGAFGINTVAAASFRTTEIQYSTAAGGASLKSRHRDAVVNVVTSNAATFNSRSAPGISIVAIQSVSSDVTYNVLFNYVGIGLTVSTGQIRE